MQNAKLFADVAELAVAALERYAAALDAAPAHPGESTRRTLTADRLAADSALVRLAAQAEANGAERAKSRAAVQAFNVREQMMTAEQCRRAAEQWDSFALSIDP